MFHVEWIEALYPVSLNESFLSAKMESRLPGVGARRTALVSRCDGMQLRLSAGSRERQDGISTRQPFLIVDRRIATSIVQILSPRARKALVNPTPSLRIHNPDFADVKRRRNKRRHYLGIG